MDVTRQTVLYVGGLGRSGSTLVEKLLNEVDDTFAVGETLHLWERGVRDQERCGCGQPFAQCEHWSAVGREAFNGWENVDLERIIGLRWQLDRSRRLPAIFAAHKSRPLSADEEWYVEQFARVLTASAQVAGQPAVLLESSKHLSTAGLLSLSPDLDVRVLHLMRDPRGVAYSWTKEVKRPEAEEGLMPTYRPARTAGRWVSDNLGFVTLAGLGVPTLRLRYEDFLDAPEASLRAILEFVDLDPSQPLGFLDGQTATIRSPMHSVAGNPLRFGGQELKLRLDDAWRDGLEPNQRRLVTAITGPAMAYFGYRP